VVDEVNLMLGIEVHDRMVDLRPEVSELLVELDVSIQSLVSLALDELIPKSVREEQEDNNRRAINPWQPSFEAIIRFDDVVMPPQPSAPQIAAHLEI